MSSSSYLYETARNVRLRIFIALESVYPDQFVTSPKSIRTDPQAQAMIDEYRARFSRAPIGAWVDCLDDYLGIDFFHCSSVIFTEDGKGQCISEEKTVQFVWRSVGSQVIEVRCVEHIPPLEDYTSEEIEENQRWHRVEYDFLVPQHVNVPVIFDVESRNSARILEGTIKPSDDLWFLQCFRCQSAGPLKSQNERWAGERSWTRNST